MSGGRRSWRSRSNRERRSDQSIVLLGSMKTAAVLGSTCLVAALTMGCNSATRHNVLTFFFDGVPPPRTAPSMEEAQAAPHASPAPARGVGYREHGPYAARLCNACHEPAATNSLVAPAEDLCLQCHDLRRDKKYIHGPLFAGGCIVCHDPHSSQYSNLLVSESDNFCFHCHDRGSVERTAAHVGTEGQCTFCHDAHTSNKKYLLK